MDSFGTFLRVLHGPSKAERDLSEAKAEIIRLEDAIRDMMDVASGWSRPMEPQKRLTTIVGIGDEALRG